MSVPPPGGWPPPQQPGRPAGQGQPYDPSGYNPQQPPPPGWQQGAWAPHSAPPPHKGNSLKWLLIGVAVLLVVAISVGATLLFTRDGNGGGGTTSTSGAPSDIASANDTGPVAIIMDEPTCDRFVGINNSLADIQAKGWGDQRSTLGPSAEWTSDQRAEVQAVATATRNAVDQSVLLAKQTPHRIVRELYEQFISYGRAYADSVATYTPADDELASANVNASSAIIGICNSITYKSVNRGIALGTAKPPSNAAPTVDTKAQRFVVSSDATCRAWIERSEKFTAATAAWEKLDSSIPGPEWTPDRRATEQNVQPLISAYADEMEAAGRESGNPVMEDFAVGGALYLRAYVTVGESYTSVDSWLSSTGFRFSNLVESACRAVAG